MPGPYGTAAIKKRLFALCIVGWGLDRSLQGNGKQAFSCSQNKTRGPLCPGAARDVLM